MGISAKVFSSRFFVGFFLIVFSLSIQACGTVKVPDRFSTIKEIYPPNQTTRSVLGTPPPDAVKKGTFAAPYVDVFQAVKVGATQAQFNIEEIYEDKGLILATRTLSIRNPYGGVTTPATRIYSYAILVEELGAELSQVSVYAKVQDSCYRESGGTWTAVSCLTFGIAAPTAAIAIPMAKKECEAASTVRWATDGDSSLQEMGQLMTFVRNNLIASGLL